MSAKTDTWMPLYIGDYLADTMHLSGPEHGAYLLLIMHYWRTGPLPDDDRQLAAIARTARKAWLEIGPTVRAFFRSEGGRLHHGRIDAELQAAREITDQKRAAANARWDRERSTRNARADAHAYADASEPHPNRISPSPSPSPVEDSVANATAPADADAPPAPPDVRTEFWQTAVPIFRRLTGKPEAPSRAFLGRFLRDLRDDCALGLALVRQCEDMRPGDPVAWLTAAAKARDRPRESHQQREQRRVLDALGLSTEIPA